MGCRRIVKVLLPTGREDGQFVLLASDFLCRKTRRFRILRDFETVSNHSVIWAQEVEVVYPRGENGHVYHKVDLKTRN